MDDDYKTYKVVSRIEVDKDGKEQTIWHNVGSLVIYENGTGKLRLNMFPSEQYHIFDKEQQRDTMSAGQRRMYGRARELAEG